MNIGNLRPEIYGLPGATYQTIVGDDGGTTPIRLGLQVSPPGYTTGTHAHPYMEVVTVIEGKGEA